jgi:acetoin utilization protein AcuB
METKACMKHPVVTVKPLDSIRHAREIMEERRINQLPVVIDGRLVGIVTDRDLRDAFPSVFDQLGGDARTTEVADPATIRVEDVMTPAVLTLPPDAPVEDAARLMRRERIGALPVVAQGRLVGILTRSDVLGAYIARTEPRADAQERAASRCQVANRLPSRSDQA